MTNELKRKTVFRIRDHLGSYYAGGGSFPRFGASFEDAATFTDGIEAYHVINTFPMMVLADLVNSRKQKCDVTGKAIRS